MVSTRRLPGLGLFSLFISLVFASSAAHADVPPPRVLVLPFEGSAPTAERAAASRDLVTALRGFERLDVVSLLDPAETLGARLAEALSSCTDDGCRAKQLAGLGAGTLVAGSLNEVAGVLRVDVRRVETTTIAATLRSRATLEIARGGGAELAARLFGIAADLFPEEADRAFGTLTLEIEPEGAQVFIDDTEVGRSPLAPLQVKAGPHRLRVQADGHGAASRELSVGVGESQHIEVLLERRRGHLPWILGGTAVGVAVVGVVLGASAAGTAANWDDGCPAGLPCGVGFTRARYLDDDGSVDTQRTLANVLFGTAVALSVGAILGYVFDPGTEE